MTAKTPTERTLKHRANAKKAGARVVQVWLTAESARRLDELEPEYGTISAAINAAIMAQRKRGKKS